ncbi:helix-turn-helix domain-containing protein [Nostoc sp. FACHB-87]|uniref:helix-turn-helix domain-containing protein n=1 Tax=Nostocales TaxID=1161 RepID=UPI001684AAEB|nr:MULTISPECIES: RodZ domain-containing protein [Nostocales]MBD2302412.1 helix-turn-helix domain-containing protein [Nostoc sp. FACHB-190]MBD2455966.1 helix-turn-helix domain-containing protein [Nostoc sp. FACHB-87]MBD2474552.1 helix-turn-helix domain-containing protein [Anabaena sp. FACHB-83]MBD2486909.1 helix-turn-helix domain-containing protein [Aulosira sp. FACHB-615]
MKWFKVKSKNNEQPTLTLEQQRAEKLKEMGAQLWAARQEKSLSLEEMVVITKISRRLLQAIEEGNLEDLPEPVYIQGFIRQYADALGFNGTEFAKAFPVTVIPATPTAVAPVNRSLKLLRPVHLYLLYIFVIICSVSSLSKVLNGAELSADNNSQPETVSQPAPNSKPENTAAESVSNNQENQTVQIGVTLKAASWIRVVADGKTEFEGVLPEGSHRVWKAQEQLTVKTDNAGGVMMSVNQQEARQMGEPGKAEEVKIAAAKPQS